MTDTFVFVRRTNYISIGCKLLNLLIIRYRAYGFLFGDTLCIRYLNFFQDDSASKQLNVLWLYESGKYHHPLLSHGATKYTTGLRYVRCFRLNFRRFQRNYDIELSLKSRLQCHVVGMLNVDMRCVVKYGNLKNNYLTPMLFEAVCVLTQFDCMAKFHTKQPAGTVIEFYDARL